MMLDAIKSERLNHDKVRAWLGKYWEAGERPCSVCNDCNWNVSDQPLQVKSFGWEKLTDGGTMVVLMVITCKTCGQTHFLNALAAGLIEIQE